MRPCEIEAATGRSKGNVNSNWYAARKSLARAGVTL
jgi:hypothetical protein